MAEPSSVGNYNAVSIFKPGPGLDEEALKSVLEQRSVREKPIMLLSVAGAFRKGKSFLLTFLLRYLRNEGHSNPEWLGEEDINDGFIWKGGSAAVTQGIQIWNEPFFIKNKKEQEVAIFLMDTQGLFEHGADKELCTKIFAFSTLLSSVQVFNLFHQIQENDLEYLQLFVEYASAAKKKEYKENIPFQRLVFLIRDWQHCGDHDFGLDEPEGGYLDGVLRKGVSSPLPLAVRDGIRKSFKNLDCFLMPDPGRKVSVTRKNNKFSGQVKDIDEEFLENVGNLATCLLSPGSVVVKAIENKTATSTDLLNFAISCSRNVMNEAMPIPKSLRESRAEVHSLKALEECRARYEELVDEKFKDSVPEAKVKKIHDKIVAEVKASLKEKLTFGGDKVASKYMEQFTEWVEIKESLVRKKNGFLMETKIYEMRQKRQKLATEYEEEAYKNPEKSKSIWKKTEKAFEKEFSSYPKYSQEKEKLERLRVLIDKSFQRHAAKKRRAAATKSVLLKEKEIVEKVGLRLVKSIFSIESVDEFEKKLEELDKADHGKFSDVFSEDEVDDDRLQEYLKFKFESIVGYLCGHLLGQYGRIMSEGIKDRYVKSEVMHDVHGIVSKHLIDKFRSDEKQREYSGSWVEEMREKCERNLENALKDAFEDFFKLNENHGKIFMITTCTVDSFIHSLGDITIQQSDVLAIDSSTGILKVGSEF